MQAYDNHPSGETAIRSRYGITKAGEPLSLNRAPCNELAPWIARLWVMDVDAPNNNIIRCGLCSDTPVMRMLFRGVWTVQTRYGTGRYQGSAVMFGPHSKMMSVKLRGPFTTLGVALKPGALQTLGGPAVADTLDRIIYYDDIMGNEDWGTSKQLINWFDPDGQAERWMRVAEKLLLQLIERNGSRRPDPIIEAFDRATFENPNMKLNEFAADIGVEKRRLERLVKKAYGQTPKQVLRRARALDIAAHLASVADYTEADEIALRYYDQSHMIREFSAFFGTTPKRFSENRHMLLTNVLEARQARRLESLGRIRAGEDLPWRNSAQTS